MREKLRKVAIALVGVAVMTGGVATVADAAKHGKRNHARKAAKAKQRQSNASGTARTRPEALTGDTKTQAEAAALAEVDGTVDGSFAARADNPAGAAYVVRITKSDDTHVIVLEDAAFAVLAVRDARPCGGRGGGDRGRPAPLTGDTKTQAEAAAQAALPDAEVKGSHAARADNPDGAVYVVVMENADDTYVRVLEDASFTVLRVVSADDRGPRGGHGFGPGRGHGPPPADDSDAS